MTAEREDLTVKERFSGQGLVETLRRERAETRKEKRRGKAPPPAGPPPTDVNTGGDRAPQEASADDTAPIASGQPPEALDDTQDPRLLAARLYRAFTQQMDQLEDRLGDLFEGHGGAAPAGGLQEIDKTVKTLASLAKTLSALMDLKSDTEPDGEDNSLDDREELRTELARRLERLCATGAD